MRTALQLPSNDDAESLFHKIVATPNLLPLIRKDDYDNNAVLACVGPKILEEHLRFVGLFTCMRQLRAINCFDLFARTYFILFSSVRSFVEDIPDQYLPKVFLNSVSKDINFHKYYIKLAIKLAAGIYTSHLGRCVNHALDSGYFDLLRDSFNSISKERVNYLLDHCEQWEKPISKSTLMMFCTESEYKKNLSETVMKTISIKIDDKNLNENIEELLNLRSKMNLYFDQWIQELRDRETLQDTNQSSCGFRL